MLTLPDLPVEDGTARGEPHAQRHSEQQRGEDQQPEQGAAAVQRGLEHPLRATAQRRRDVQQGEPGRRHRADPAGRDAGELGDHGQGDARVVQPPAEPPQPVAGQLGPGSHQHQIRLVGVGPAEHRRHIVVRRGGAEPPRHLHPLVPRPGGPDRDRGDQPIDVVGTGVEQLGRPVQARGLAHQQHPAHRPAPACGAGPAAQPLHGGGDQQPRRHGHDSRGRVDGTPRRRVQDGQYPEEHQPVAEGAERTARLSPHRVRVPPPRTA